MSKRVVARALVVAAIAGVIAAPGAARAQEVCRAIPFSSTGVTIEVAGESIRVPAIDGLGICYVVPGIPGTPWVYTEPGGGVSVVIRGSSGNDGHFVFTYETDNEYHEIRVPLTGLGGGSEICLVGIGSPARADCLVKVSPDEIPTVEPLPTPEPIPTVPPVATPEPDPLCVGPKPTCVPYGGVLQGTVDLVVRIVGALLDDGFPDPCRNISDPILCP